MLYQKNFCFYFLYKLMMSAIDTSRVFKCSLSSVPETNELLKKSRMPFGLTLHPFRDMKNLTVIQTNIVRCRYCRTYINPYVALPDSRHWKCNLCFKVNDCKLILFLTNYCVFSAGRVLVRSGYEVLWRSTKSTRNAKLHYRVHCAE